MSDDERLPLAVSTGDPGGVGPEVSLRAALALDDPAGVVLFGDAEALERAALALGAAPERLRRLAPDAAWVLDRGALGLCDAGIAWDKEARTHAPTVAGGRAQLAALELALAAVRSGRARALVTAPMSKEAAQRAGVDFVGHTEHLARACGLADDDVTMMFLGPRLRVALATTHVAVAALPAEVTSRRVERAIAHLAQALLRVGPSPRERPGRGLVVVVTGLNPHAGEAGIFGREEIDVIAPAVERARRAAPFAGGSISLEGPEGAETALRRAAAGEVSGVVAMTHDQATIASKLLDWQEAVNVTWGLPFVRTSVDHGVAYAAAGGTHVDARGMRAALEMAKTLVRGRREPRR